MRSMLACAATAVDCAPVTWERALTIAGWSEGARRDIEIFRVVDKEGLTPLLMVLNEPFGDVTEASGGTGPEGAADVAGA